MSQITVFQILSHVEYEGYNAPLGIFLSKEEAIAALRVMFDAMDARDSEYYDAKMSECGTFITDTDRTISIEEIETGMVGFTPALEYV
jgi:hypothetical protein